MEQAIDEVKVSVKPSRGEARSVHGQEGWGVIFILLSAFGFGVMGVFAVWAYAAATTTVTLLTLRFALAAALLWPYLLLTKQPLGLPGWGKLLGLGLLGAMYVGQAMAYFNSIKFIPVAVTSIILFIHPAIVAVLAWLIFKEHLSVIKLAALFLALLGVALVVGAPAGTARDLPLGFGIALIGVVTYSVYIILGTRVMVGVGAMTASAYVFSTAALILLLYGLISGEFRPQDVQVGPTWYDPQTNGWLDIVVVSLLGTVLAITAYFAGLVRLGPTRAVIISTVEPVITALVGWLLLGQTLGWLQIGGGAVILAAVLLLQARRRKVIPDA